MYSRCKKFLWYTQVLAGDTTNKMAFLGGEEGAALCIALLCTIVLRRRLSSKKRSTWARKWLRRRRQRSIYSNLVQELREEDPDEYLKYLRMTTTTFNILLEKVRPYIEKKNTVVRNSISAAERLTVTFCFLATGELNSYSYIYPHELKFSGILLTVHAFCKCKPFYTVWQI